MKLRLGFPLLYENRVSKKAKLRLKSCILIMSGFMGLSYADVMDETNKLMPLKETHEFVGKHKHLPEIPSAKELNEKGMDLAEMNLLLLKKVEELNVFSIAHEAERKKQADEMQQMQKKWLF